MGPFHRLPGLLQKLASVVVAMISLTAAFSPLRAAEAAKPTGQTTAVPLVFERNEGQFPSETRFLARTQAYSVSVTDAGMTFLLPGSQPIRLGLEDASATSASGLDAAPFLTNSYIGSNPSQWHAGIHNFRRVQMAQVYPGIDSEIYANGQQVEHDFYVAAGADAGRIGMRLSGAEDVTIDASGDIVLQEGKGALRLKHPVAYQVDAQGVRVAVPAAFTLASVDGDRRVGFELGAYDHTRRLVIDPVITYATYVAGSLGSVPAAVVSDAAGNVYLTGYTSSAASTFYAASTSGSAAATSTNQVSFLAKMAANASGSQIAWLTYYGSSNGSTLANALALSGSTLYLGGQTAALDLPTVAAKTSPTFQSAPSGAGSYNQFGFVSNFATATGVFGVGTYVDGVGASNGLTLVTALSATSSGVVIAGETQGNVFPVTSNALSGNGLASVIANTSLFKGIILQLDPTLTTEAYGTYLAGNNANTTTDTSLTGVTTDSAGKIYVSGTTRGFFPQAGVYSSAAMYQPVNNKQGANSFAVQLIPASKTLGYSFWSNDTLDTVITGLTLDSSGDLYIYGRTQDTAYTTSGTTTSISALPGAPTTTPLDANYPSGAVYAGIVTKIDPSGKILSSTYLGATGATNTVVQAGIVDPLGNLYLAGRTDAPKTAFPQATNGTGTSPATGYTTLPSGQDLSASGSTHGFLMQMAGSLTGLNYLGYFGPSAGNSSAVGVALDGLASPNAYVLLSETPNGGGSFTTASAIQQAPQKADGNTTSAVLAKIANASPASSASIVAGTQSYTPTRVAYQSATNYTSFALTFQVVGSANGASNVVFNLPYNSNLQPYTATPTVTVGGTASTGVCTLGTSSVAGTTPGITCVLPTVANGSVAQFSLPVALSATAPRGGSFTVTANAYDAQSDSLALAIPVTTAGVPTLTLSVSAAPTTSGFAYVNAALASDTLATYTQGTGTPDTRATYTYTIANTSSYDSPATSLSLGTITLNGASGSPIFVSDANPVVKINGVTTPSCDPVGKTCDVPAGGNLTYTITGSFPGSGFGTTTSGPFSASFLAAALPVATVTSPVLTTPPTVSASTNPAITIHGDAALSAALTIGAATYNGGFRLGDKSVPLTLTVTNAGPNQAASGSVLVTLPSGFTPASFGTCTAPGTYKAGTAFPCSFSNLPAGSSNTTSFVITGSFDDTGTSTDVVPPPSTDTSKTVQQRAAASAVQANWLPTAVVQASTGSSYFAQSTAPTFTVPVSRANALTYTLTVTPPLANNTVNVTNPTHISDAVSYTASVTNSGVSVARGLYFTIPLPSASTATVSPTTITPTYTSAPSTANALTCVPYTGGDAQITCYTNDLTTAPTTATSTPASEGYTVAFATTFAPATVTSPATTASLSQSAGTVGAASATYTSGVAGAVTPASFIVQRVPQTIAFTGPATPVTYGAAPVALSATSSSGLAVTFSVVSGPGTINGSTLTITGAGTIVIAADQAGSSIYAPATEVTQSIVVNQASQTIAFTPPATPVAFGSGPVALSATATSSLPVTFSVVSGPGTLSGSTLTITGAGTIVIAANQAGNANYAAATQVTQSIVVNQATQTIVFTPPATPVAFGSGTVALSATASSSLPVTFSVVSGPGTVSGGTLTITGVGTIVLAANQAGNANYSAASQVTQSIVVTQATQTINFTLATSVSYGTAPIALSATASSGLAVTFTVTGPATISGSTLTITGAGSVVVTASQTGNANYSAATQVVKTLTVNKATPNVTLTTSANPVFLQSSVTLTASVSAGATGSVSFMDGTTLLGSGVLANGVATYATSALAAGTHSITAVYAGDANYTTLTSLAVAEAVQDFTLALANGASSSATAQRGGTAIYQLAATPSGGTSFPGAIALTVTGVPAGATIVVTPSTLASGASATSVTVSVQVPSNLASTQRPQLGRIAHPFAFALLILPLAWFRRSASARLRRAGILLLLLLAAVGSVGLTGCGAGMSSKAPEAYTITVTGAAGTLTHSVTLNLTVN